MDAEKKKNEYFEQYVAEGKQMWEQEKQRQIDKRNAERQKEYAKLIKTMDPENAITLQDKREAQEILKYMQKRTKKDIKRAARKRNGKMAKIKSIVTGAILGGATYLGLSKVVDTEDKLITRPLNQSEYNNEVAKNYLQDGAQHELVNWDKTKVDWDSADWYDQWLSALKEQLFPAYGSDFMDKRIVDSILNNGEYSFIYREFLEKAPNNQNAWANTRYTIIGTGDERLEMYTYAFNEKWGMDASSMTREDDIDKLVEIMNTQGNAKGQEFLHDLTLYRSMTFENSDYLNQLDPGAFVMNHNDYSYYLNFDSFADYLDTKEATLMNDSMIVTGISNYASDEHFIREIAQEVANGNTQALNMWNEYFSINQARVISGGEDSLYYSTPSEILPMFGIDNTDAIFQKYAELGTDEATVARLLMIEHPGCNTFHADGSIHMTDAGALTGDALIKFNEDLAYFQDLMTKADGLSALEYANTARAMELGIDNLITIPTTTTELVQGADPMTHINIPAGLVFLMGFFLKQRHNLNKAVKEEIYFDIVAAKIARDLSKIDIAKELDRDCSNLNEAELKGSLDQTVVGINQGLSKVDIAEELDKDSSVLDENEQKKHMDKSTVNMYNKLSKIDVNEELEKDSSVLEQQTNVRER
ncbi:MAG: hypothetical protein IKC79_03215 [Clostridia bacterium]|nr:hypothetical protein [Clostridia bacterium]